MTFDCQLSLGGHRGIWGQTEVVLDSAEIYNGSNKDYGEEEYLKNNANISYASATYQCDCKRFVRQKGKVHIKQIHLEFPRPIQFAVLVDERINKKKTFSFEM